MEWKELERYRPIPREGARLLAWVALAALVALGDAFFLGMIFPEATLSIDFWKGWMILYAIALTTLFRLGAERINDYWRLNVRSYDACFWIKNDDGIDPDVGVQIIERHRSSYWMPCELNEHGKIFLRVPLGGWFQKQGLLYRVTGEGRSSERSPFRAWRIKVRQPITDPYDSCIEVIDGKGDRIPLTVSATLRFAAWLSVGGIQEWRHEVPDLLRAVRESRAELDEVRRERDEAMKQAETLDGEVRAGLARRNAALAAMHRTIVAIKGTSRFGKSKDAKRIREDLEETLRAIIPKGAHPLKSIYAPTQPAAPAAAEAQ